MSYLYIEGTASSLPRMNENPFTEDDTSFSLRVKFMLPAWGTGSVQGLVSNAIWNTGGFYLIQNSSADNLILYVCDSTPAMQSAVFDPVTDWGFAGVPENEVLTLRFDVDADTREVQAFSSDDDGNTWTLLDNPKTLGGSNPFKMTGAATTTLFGGASSQVMTGQFYWSELYVDGSPKWRADFTNLSDDDIENAAFTEEWFGYDGELLLTGWTYVPYIGKVAGKTPELLLKASDYQVGNPKWPDLSGNDHHAQFGSAAGADTNDPLFKPWNGVTYVYLPATNVDTVSTPNDAAMQHTGDFAVEIKFRIPNWNSASYLDLASIWGGAGVAAKWWLSLTSTNGNVQLAVLDSAGDNNVMLVPSSGGTTDGAWHVLRVEVDVDNGAGGSSTEAFIDGVSVGTGTDVSSAGDVRAGSDPLIISARNGGSATQPLDVEYLQYENLVTSTIIARYDAADAEEPFATQTGSVDGRTWTYNRSASGLVTTVVDRPMFLLTTDDYFEIPDDAALDFVPASGDEWTVLSVVRVQKHAAGPYTIIAKKAGLTTGAGWASYFLSDDAVALIQDSDTFKVDVTDAPLVANQTLHAFAMRVVGIQAEAGLDSVMTGSPSTVLTGDGNVSNAQALSIGRRTGGNYYEGQIIAVALWREALTDAEIAAVGAELTGSGVPQMMLMGVG